MIKPLLRVAPLLAALCLSCASAPASAPTSPDPSPVPSPQDSSPVGGDDDTAATIKAEPLDYEAGGVTLKGFLAYDEAITDKRPGVIVVHEWWGHNDYARSRAKQLAALGYTALAVDMYGEGKQAGHPDDASKFSSAVFAAINDGEARFNAALEILKAHPTVDPERIAAIGYCFGGGVVMHMARIGSDLDGVVMFHGGVGPGPKPATAEAKNTKVLVCHGADDPFVKPEAVEVYKKEMKDAGIDMRFRSYEGAKHSFTNPLADEFGKKFELPLAYNAAADEQSWAEMQAFFAEIFTKN